MVEPELIDGGPVVPSSSRRRVLGALVAVGLAATMLIGLWPQAPGSVPGASAADKSTVTILAGSPASLDPAKHGDLGSASYVSQLYETLTAVDPTLTVRPALAESWTVEDAGQRVTFTLRPGLTFSDGTPLTAADVVHSWRRLFAPGDPSPLASLAANIVGARALLSGQSSDVATLGVRAEGDRTVVVDLERGGGDLPAIVSGAPFAVVPPSATNAEIVPDPATFVGSGGYVLSAVEQDAFVLTANPHYWAGKPAIETARMLTTLTGGGAVDAFAAGDVDVTPVSYLDSGWLAYDRVLGPSLRSDPSLSVTYYGFDTRVAPFNDVRVRRAFAEAVDWAPPRRAGRARVLGPGHGHGPGRHARRTGRRLHAAVRPRRRPPAPRRRRLSGRHGSPRGLVHRQWRRLRRGDRRDAAGEPGRDDRLRHHGFRDLPGAPRHGPAADLEPVVGGGLSGAQRLPRRAPRDRLHGQPGRLVQRRFRRRHHHRDRRLEPG